MTAKGISPMIAIVLLVAFTVAVGGILSLWLTNYVTETTGSVQTATENHTACSGSYINIISVTSQSVIVTIPGSETISSLSCYAQNGTQLGGISGSLSPGSSDSSTWDSTTPQEGITNYESGFGTSIFCTGTCRNIGIVGECKSTQPCWDM